MDVSGVSSVPPSTLPHIWAKCDHGDTDPFLSFGNFAVTPITTLAASPSRAKGQHRNKPGAGMPCRLLL
jgi:hypothetical protein